MIPMIDQDTLRHILESAAIFMVAILAFVLLKGRILAFAQWANLPALAFAPVRTTLRYSLLVVALLVVLGRWGFETGTLMAALASILGLVAIGFVAMWSVLSNFLCTFVLVAFRPFQVGDELELPTPPGTKGRVVDLSLFFTTLEVSESETIMVPNNTFFQVVFRRRRGAFTIGLGEQLKAETPHHASSTPVA